MNVYEKCHTLENDNLIIKKKKKNDADDLMSVYNDKFVLPFFNSDNCHGSNFYCATKEDMENTIKYWLIEYHENRGFVRFSVVDKKAGTVIGTIEMFQRKSQDFYNDCGILRLDLARDYERSEWIGDILSLITEPFYDWFGCSVIATKAAVYAIERIEALKKKGFIKSEEPLIGHYRNTVYYDYWIIQKS